MPLTNLEIQEISEYFSREGFTTRIIEENVEDSFIRLVVMKEEVAIDIFFQIFGGGLTLNAFFKLKMNNRLRAYISALALQSDCFAWKITYDGVEIELLPGKLLHKSSQALVAQIFLEAYKTIITLTKQQAEISDVNTADI